MKEVASFSSYLSIEINEAAWDITAEKEAEDLEFITKRWSSFIVHPEMDPAVSGEISLHPLPMGSSFAL